MLRNTLLAAAGLILLLGLAMLAMQTPAVGITAIGALLVAAVLLERLRHARRALRVASSGASGEGRANLAAPAQEVDIVQAYRFFLGRDPESPNAVASRRGKPLRSLIGELALSDEYEERLVRTALEDGGPVGGLFDEPPPDETLAWAARSLPLGAASHARLEQVPDWIAVHALVLADRAMRSAFPALKDRMSEERVAAFAAAAARRTAVAEIEDATGRLVRGYALDRAEAGAVLDIELWIDGVFARAARADEYRRDLEERFGGDGRHGFTFEGLETADVEDAQPVRIEIRSGASRRVLGVRHMSLRPTAEARRISSLADELHKTRQALNGIERSLELISGAHGFTLESYDSYRRAYYLRAPAQEAREREEMAAFLWRPRFEVVVTGSVRDGVWADATVESLQGQVYGAHAAVLALQHSGEGPPTFVGDYVVLVDAGDRLAPDALHRLAAAMQADRPALLIFDSDTINGDGVHRDPVFRPGFDYDLLLQEPSLGSTGAVRTDVLRQALEAGADLRPTARGDLWLRVVEIAGPAGVRHVPRVLHHAAPSSPASASPADLQTSYAQDVRAHFARIGSHAQVREGPDRTDPVSPRLPRLRVAWPTPEGTKAAVIVPTRDRMDLLGPCLASLQASRAANRTIFEVVVVDNGSVEADTRRALEAFGAQGGRVLSYGEAFNWSAINNFAARSVEADVLVFLNNDTVVLSADWCDALCAQALRPEVGAVGARLLYDDGSIQHAGIVLGTTHALAAHEGAGAPAQDAGYLGRRGLAHRAAAVTGACLATRRELFLHLGGFDEAQLAIEANDIDYCLRVRREGLAVLYEPACTFRHFESRSRGHTDFDAGRRARAATELAALERRWGGEVRRDPCYNGHFDRMSRPFARLGPPPPL